MTLLVSCATPLRFQKPILIWLFVIGLAVFGMVVIGGLTRLTESGLSIVEWKPVAGTLPPLTDAAWQEEFAAYQTSPQYVKVNQGMTVSEFKQIFWLEYLHRLAGRVIGFIFLIPMLYFAAKRALPRWLGLRLLGIFALGGMQAVIGWLMVKSGLVDQPYVSPVRLAIHLGVAFIILGLVVWTFRQVMNPPTDAPLPRSGRHWVGGLVMLVFVQTLLGALVAGLDAGLTYNTFPLMDGRWIPEGAYLLEPLWLNHVENVTMVQFQHRVGALVVTLWVIALGVWMHSNTIQGRFKRSYMLFLVVFVVQVGLGISTLLLHVPISLASLHQSAAAFLFAIGVWMWYDIRALSPCKRAAVEAA